MHAHGTTRVESTTYVLREERGQCVGEGRRCEVGSLKGIEVDRAESPLIRDGVLDEPVRIGQRIVNDQTFIRSSKR